ncbi:hypothetical protein PV367_24365 [Streptomyces europaeiscabiei]|uniref:Uncharacterized protein n=1 Tax=Streptomyces europaeiscabiei TaxID=146819 RepID=A0AAJ2UMU3_9ACTN|nr:hypothetical protein [Streptomyces europaeiscabiei]MDX3132838.1 hypothetical protein [Streptomyces europaeiscabiei]
MLLSLLPPAYVMSSDFVPAADAVTKLKFRVVGVVSAHLEPDASVPDMVSGSASFAGTEVV